MNGFFDAAMSRDKEGKIQFHSISIVQHCPYCGTDDWSKPTKKKNGEICNHPTRFKPIEQRIENKKKKDSNTKMP